MTRLGLLAALALTGTACSSCGEDAAAHAPGGQLSQCLESRCPVDATTKDPCAAFDRPMACVNADVARERLGAQVAGCAAVCWTACATDGSCAVPETTCEDLLTARLCVPLRCGNGFVQPGEECDDAATDDAGACLAGCRLAVCGDGKLRAGVEECDDGGTDDDGDCLADCRRPRCGDGKLRRGYEECDDGAGNGPHAACLPDCTRGRCGDGLLLSGAEECDDGAGNDEAGACLADCTHASCGDGRVYEGFEECDNGADNGEHGSCLPSCRAARCGDGLLAVGLESCDDGTDNAPDGACLPDCRRNVCGDGRLLAGVEECDLGALNDDHGACVLGCRRNVCGDDKILSGVEQCDEGTDNRDDGYCLSDCRTARCGDGRIFAGFEDCDDGAANAAGARCLPGCRLASCGDGRVLLGVEECDAGADNRPDGACLPGCRRNVCGDGKVLAGAEECDAGTDNRADGACLPGCRAARCGDGLVQAGVEACDAGTDNRADGACLPGCAAARCGDGFLRAGVEECDAGTDNRAGGACLPGCVAARCGDGFLRAGAEQCDHGAANGAAGDPCDATCRCAPPWYDLRHDGTCERLPACVVHVTQGGTGDGATWATAKGSVQAAVDAAAAAAALRADGRCQVWIAQGSYPVTGFAGATLRLGSAVDVYGGFAGGESAPEARALDQATGLPLARSVLDGRGLSVHVVTGASGALLDGVVITGGRGELHHDERGCGAGLYSAGASGLLVRRVRFEGNRARWGGALGVLAGSVTVEHGYFDGNTAVWDGGALYARGAASLTLRDTTFRANSTPDGHGGAGAVVDTASTTLQNVRLLLNAARWEGGAWWHVGGRVLDIAGSSFHRNNPVSAESALLGGGLFARGCEAADVAAGVCAAEGRLATLAVSRSDFVTNHADREGGGVYLRGVDDASFVKVVMDGNTSVAHHDRDGSTDDGGRGGALAAYGLGAALFAQTAVTNNRARYDGGGFYLDGLTDLDVVGADFRANVSDHAGGGGIRLHRARGDVAVSSTTFSHNRAPMQGIGLAAEGFRSLSVIDCKFESNRPPPDGGNGLPGGGLYAVGDAERSSALLVVRSQFFENHVDNTGGALAAFRLGEAEIAGCEFGRNGRWVTESGSQRWTGIGGAAVLGFVGSIRVSSSHFAANGKSNLGSALYAGDYDDLVLDGVQVRGHDNFGGGALWLCTSRPNETPDLGLGGNCSNAATNAQLWGHGLPTRTWAGRTAIRRSTFADNTVDSWGAAVLFGYRLDSLSLEDSTVSANVSPWNNAPLHLEAMGDVSVRRSRFLDNGHTQGGWASALAVRGANDVLVEDSELRGNHDGAALFLERIRNLAVRRSTVAASSGGSQWGIGAVYAKNVREVEITDSTFEDCTSRDGAAVVVQPADGWPPVVPPDMDIDRVRVANSVFRRNHAQNFGAGLAIRGAASATVEGCTFEDNVVDGSNGISGGLHLESVDTVVVRGGAFRRNLAQTSGGAMRVMVARDVTLDGVLFEGNEQQAETGAGGAVELSNDNGGTRSERLVVKNCRFVGNGAARVGGGLKAKRVRDVQVTDTAFVGNRAVFGPGTHGSGGGLSLNQVDEVLVQRATFLDNRVVSGPGADAWNGGGLYIDYGLHVRVLDSLFARNAVFNGRWSGGGRGGGLMLKPWTGLDGSGAPTLAVTGCTFVGNSAANGSAIDVSHEYMGEMWPGPVGEVTDNFPVTLKNTIVWGNTGGVALLHKKTAGGWQSYDPPATWSSSISQLAADPANGVVMADPKFLAPSAADPYQEFRPGPGSPALGAADPAAASASDVTGAPRGATPDIGAVAH